MPINCLLKERGCILFPQTIDKMTKQPANCLVKGRFAPSPTARMHAGNIFSALICWLLVKAQGGRIVLRIEDLDSERSKQEYIDYILRDFELLGLTWDEGPYFQHDRKDAYYEAFEKLDEKGLLYPCFCTRADIRAASAPHAGDMRIYSGTCRNLTKASLKQKIDAGKPFAWRIKVPDETISFTDEIQGNYTQNLTHDCGDFIIRRANGDFAYQLAVVVDDTDEEINYIVRGQDLLSSVPAQLYLGKLLDLPRAHYAHVPLLVGPDKRRLSKRNRDTSLDILLERFKTPEAIIGHIAGITGLLESSEPVSAEELLKEVKDTINTGALSEKFISKTSIIWN